MSGPIMEQGGGSGGGDKPVQVIVQPSKSYISNPDLIAPVFSKEGRRISKETSAERTSAIFGLLLKWPNQLEV